MSIETLAPGAAVAPSAYCPPPVTDLPAPDPAPPASATTASLQQRRMRVARELDARLSAQARDIRELQAALATLRQGTGESLRELQQRSTSLTTEMLRQGARMARQRRELDEDAQVRGTDLERRLQPLDVALAATTGKLQRQQALLEQLHERLDGMACLHDHLDRVVNRQGRAQDLMTAELRERVDLLRALLEEGRQDARAQHEALLDLRLQHDTVAVQAGQAQEEMERLAARCAAQAQRDGRRLRRLGYWLVAATLLCLGGSAWLQLHPGRLPPQASHRLAALEARLARQDRQDAVHDLRLRQQASELARLQQALAQARDRNARLRAATLRLQDRLHQLQSRLARLDATPAPQTSATPALAPVHASIPLPPAVPGSLPTF